MLEMSTTRSSPLRPLHLQPPRMMIRCKGETLGKVSEADRPMPEFHLRHLKLQMFKFQDVSPTPDTLLRNSPLNLKALNFVLLRL